MFDTDSTQIVQRVLEEEAKDLNNDYSKVILGGFSQGACVTYNTFLNLSQNLGALVALSGHAPPIDIKNVTEDKKKVPIFAYHGQEDPMVPETLHRQAAKTLKDAG